MCTDVKGAKPEEVSPQHSGGKKERESTEMNDYEDEGDLLEEEEVRERETTVREIISPCSHSLYTFDLCRSRVEEGRMMKRRRRRVSKRKERTMETAPTETILKRDSHGHTCMLTVRYRVDPLTLNSQLMFYFISPER